MFKLSKSVVKTLLTATNGGATDTQYTVRRQFTGTTNSSGVVTFSAGSNETFVAFAEKDYTLSILTAGDGTGAQGDIVSISGNISGTGGGTITITDAANGDINIAPNGTGEVQAGGSVVNNAGTQTIWVPAQAMFGTTTNGADAQAVETTATRPELKVLDFDASTAEYSQFSIAMPKSWNLGTVTYQVFWSPGNTNTGNCIFGLQGVSCTEGDTADVVFGTAQEVTDAGIGTVEDVQMTAASSAMTIAGSPADDDYTFFQVYRDAADGRDTFTGDARLLGIKLFYTTDSANDA